MTEFTVLFVFSGEDEKYLEQASKSRNITKTQIVRRAVEFVLKDKLFLSIFDDDDKPNPKTEPKPRKPRGRARLTYVQREMFDPSVSHSVPTRTLGRRCSVENVSVPKTRAQFELELQQAILNTGGELSEP